MEKPEGPSWYSNFDFDFVFFFFCAWRGLSSAFCCPPAVWSHLLFATRQMHPAPFFSKLGGSRMWQQECWTSVGSRSCHRVGIWICPAGKIPPWEAPAPCPVGNQRVQPGSLRNHSPESHQRALLGKTGRDWPLKCCSALSYLRECVEDLAGLPQGLCYQDLVSVDLQENKVWILCSFQWILLSSSPKQLHRKAEEERFVHYPPQFLIPATSGGVSNEAFQNPICSWQDKYKGHKAPCAAGIATPKQNLGVKSQTAPLGLKSSGIVVEREIPPAPAALCLGFPRCSGKGIGWNWGWEERQGLCGGVGRWKEVERGAYLHFLTVSLRVWYRYFPIINQ